MASANNSDLGPVTSIPESEDVNSIPLSPMLQAMPDEEHNSMSRSQAYNLYTSHFLSTWNVRTYEFAAVRNDGMGRT